MNFGAQSRDFPIRRGIGLPLTDVTEIEVATAANYIHPLFPHQLIPALHTWISVIVCSDLISALLGSIGAYLPKLLCWLQEHFPCFHVFPFWGQCVYGLCSYPISSQKWICSFLANNAAAILCTGASPQRWTRVSAMCSPGLKITRTS